MAAKDELDLLQGTLDVLVLQALSHGPQHGYGIARFIRTGSGATFRILDGALYTALHRMEERGWVTSYWRTTANNRIARYYQLTPEGRTVLTEEIASWRRYARAMESVIED